MNYWKKKRLEVKHLRDTWHLRQHISTQEEERLGLPITQINDFLSEEEMKKQWDEASLKQLLIDRQNQLLWEEEYKKERAKCEAAWVDVEGGEGYYDWGSGKD